MDGRALAVPLIQRGDVPGCFMLHCDRRPTFSSEQHAFFQTLADGATLSLQRERLSRVAQTRSQQAATFAERMRIARELHDVLAQGPTGILVHLQASQRAPSTEQARAHVDEAASTVRVTLRESRRSLQGLRSTVGSQVKVFDALRSLLRAAFEGSRVEVDVRGEDTLRLSESMGNEVLRIAREAATSALKHARAHDFVATLGAGRDAVRLPLQDDGAGFDVNASHDGFGRTGMSERAADVHASLSIRRESREGTCITIEMPSSAFSASSSVRPQRVSEEERAAARRARLRAPA